MGYLLLVYNHWFSVTSDNILRNTSLDGNLDLCKMDACEKKQQSLLVLVIASVISISMLLLLSIIAIFWRLKRHEFFLNMRYHMILWVCFICKHFSFFIHLQYEIYIYHSYVHQTAFYHLSYDNSNLDTTPNTSFPSCNLADENTIQHLISN